MEALNEHDDIGDWSAGLEDLRRAIDGIDEKILNLLNQRLDLACRIGQVKRRGRKATLDEVREKDILKRLAAMNRGLLPQGALKRIFREIIAAARDVQSTRNRS